MLDFESRRLYYPVGLNFESAEACRVCCSPINRANVLFDEVPDIDIPDAPPFSIIACSNCGVANTDPIPTESTINLLYVAAKSSDYELPELGIVGRLKDVFARRRARAILRLLSHPPTAVLDYGTGGGRFASAMASELPNGEIIGTDFGAKPPSNSYYEQDDRIKYTPYDGLQSIGKLFDLIIARHVLEHTHHPVQFLQNLLALLNEGGVAYVEVPNLDSQTAKLLGRNWPLLYLPKHISHFTKETLQSVIAMAGANATLGHCEMPMMGNVVAIKMGQSRMQPWFRPLAVLLHPIQLALERYSHQGTCLFAMVSRDGKRGLP
jgi:2-polyprenyl-3-methyl-5-hydroxy-6-metoxy-1,4-benzoquinol methylase